MRIKYGLLVSLLVGIVAAGGMVHAQIALKLTSALSLGSSGPQVVLLQQILNKDPHTQIAASGAGSPGHETSLFGSLTRAAVIRFQEKYASEVLAPAGLSSGNGWVGAFTRAKLNALASSSASQTTAAPATASSTATAVPPTDDSLVKDSEKIDIFAGDKKIADLQQRLVAPINSAISSGNTAAITLPAIAMNDMPSVIINSISPASALPGDKVTITGQGFLATSRVYLGAGRIIRSPVRDLSGNLTFIVPPMPAQRYDLVITAGSAVSNSKSFVVRDPRNPPVVIDSISPATTTYAGVITISGSGFTPTGNIVVTPFETYTGVPSADGKTMTVTIAPDRLKTAAQIGTGTNNVPVSVSVVNDHGFSTTSKVVTLTL